MARLINPTNMHPAVGDYSLGAVAPADRHLIFTAGQFGIDTDGAVPDGIDAQTEIALENLKKVLRDGGATFADVVKTTVYLTNRADLPGFAAARRRVLGDLVPASTLVFIAGLGNPKAIVEIEAVAVT